MKMPGFSAEGSLYSALGRHYRSSAQGSLATVQKVLPQLPKSIGFCMDACDDRFDWGSVDNASCKAQCFDDGGNGGQGGGGGGGGGFPRETCGKCITVGPHKGQKLCTLPGRGHYYTDC